MLFVKTEKGIGLRKMENRAKITKARRVAEGLLGVMILILAVVMIVQVIGLFRDGAAGKFGTRDDGTNVIYTREIIRERLLTPAIVCVPAVLAVISLIAAIVLRILAPEKEKTTGKVQFRGIRIPDKTLKIVQIVVVLLAAGWITAGILNGSAEDTLIKAINICTECLGLG